MNFEGHIIKDQLIKKFRIDRTILCLEHSKRLQEYEWVVIPERITTIEELTAYLQSHLKIDLDLHLYFEDSLLRPQLPVDVLRMSKSEVLVSPKTCMAYDDCVEQSSSVFNGNKSTNSSYVQVNTDKDQTNNIVTLEDTAQSSRMQITRKECSVITENVPEQQSLILMEKMDEENSIAVPDSHIVTPLDFANILVDNNATPHKAAVHSTSALADSGNSFSTSSDLKRKLNFTDKESPETEDCGPHSSKMCKTTIGAEETRPELVSSSSSKRSVCFAPIPPPSFAKRPKRESGFSTALSPENIVTTLQPDARTRALNSHQITDWIFKLVSLQDLKSCRVVSKQFNELATKVLRRRIKETNFKLTFKYYWGLRKFVREYKERDDAHIPLSDHLEELNNCLDMANKNHQFNSFPYSDFAFKLAGVHSGDIRRFFSVFGHHIKSLCLTYELLEDSSDYHHLRNLLSIVNKIPNIEVLLLEFPWYYYSDNHETAENLVGRHEQIVYPNLKSLQLSCSAGFDILLEKIVVAAPNLQELSSSCPHLQEMLLDLEKTNLLKTFEFSPNSTNMAVLRAFVSTDPALRSLHIDVFHTFQTQKIWADVATLLNKLFMSGRHTLEQLEMMPLGFLDNVFPDLVNLKELSFHGYCGENARTGIFSGSAYFPKTMNISTSLPNLKFVSFDECSLENLEQSLDVLFPLEQRSLQHFNSVIKMKINQISNTDVHRRLTELFPMVKHLTIEFTREVDTFPVLWENWPLLESIEFNHVVFSLSKYPILDKIFTGIPENRCAIFRDWPMVVSDPDEWRTHPSICHLKSLKSLRIHIGYVRSWPTEGPSNPFLSGISGTCAFRQMSDIKVTFEVSKGAEPLYTKRVLEEALPYITIM